MSHHLSKIKLAPDVQAAPLLAQERLDFDPQTASAAFVISTVAADRDGDILNPHGCLPAFESYRRNPVVLYDHGERVLFPIGLSEDPASKQCTVTVHDDHITARVYFHQKTIESAQCCDLVANGILRGASVGYKALPEHIRLIDPRKPKGGKYFDEWEMVEWSVVPVPCNGEALRMALSARWDGKPLAATLRKSFQSMLKKSGWKRKPFFVLRQFAVQSGSKTYEEKAMPDDIQNEQAEAEQQPEAGAEETKQLPVGALCIKGLLDGCNACLAELEQNKGLNENPDAIAALEEATGEITKALSNLQNKAAGLYPDVFESNPAAPQAEEGTDEEKAAEEESPARPEERAPDAAEEEETEAKAADTEPAEGDEDEEAKEKSKSLRLTKAWKAECQPHVEALKDAGELLSDLVNSPNIPTPFKRQCKGVVPGIKSAQAWLSGKADEGAVITGTKSLAATEPAPEPDPLGEEGRKALMELQKRMQANREGLAKISGR